MLKDPLEISRSGTIGGFIENEKSFSRRQLLGIFGESLWQCVKVLGDRRICDNAMVFENAQVRGHLVLKIMHVYLITHVLKG